MVGLARKPARGGFGDGARARTKDDGRWLTAVMRAVDEAGTGRVERAMMSAGTSDEDEVEEEEEEEEEEVVFGLPEVVSGLEALVL